MPYPPVIPPNTRTDATDMVTAHARDHNQLADALTALPWGRVASTTGTGNSNISAAETDVLSVTFTAVAGRRYRVSSVFQCVSNAATMTITAALTDASNAHLQIAVISQLAAAGGYYTLAPWVEIPPGAAGSRTYKLRASTNASNIARNSSATQPDALLVEDIGT